MPASKNLLFESQAGSKEATVPARGLKYFLTTAMDASTNFGANPPEAPK